MKVDKEVRWKVYLGVGQLKSTVGAMGGRGQWSFLIHLANHLEGRAKGRGRKREDGGKETTCERGRESD